MQPRPLLFGEVLFDAFPDGQKVLGGAPFNVCWHLHGFGEQPLLISSVGADAEGSAVRQRMLDRGLDTAALQSDPQHPTGAVQVALHQGQPQFDILPDQAYDHIHADPVLPLLAQTRAALLYRGTLATRSAGNLASFERLCQAADAPVFIDVNLRTPWWNAEQVIRSLVQARWAKLNDAELCQLTGCADTPESLLESALNARRQWGLALLIVTLGARGALWIEADAVHEAAAPRVEDLADTVGAGDAFSAVSLLGLLRNWPGETSLRRALDFAARVCRNRGAIIQDPQIYALTQTQWTHDG